VRIAIDVSAQDADIEKFGKLDGVLYTHEHADHFDADLAKRFLDAGVQIYANASTAKLINGKSTELINAQELKIKSMNIRAVELPHCLMADGSAGPQNTSLLIGGRLFNPGDGKELDGLSVEALALPITGPDISIKDAFSFVKQVGARMAIPVHYDFIGTKPEVVASFIERYNLDLDLRILALGEATEI